MSRLVGTFPADDDNVYWVRRGSFEVQIDTEPGGEAPFVVESDRPGSRLDTSDPERVWRYAADELTNR